MRFLLAPLFILSVFSFQYCSPASVCIPGKTESCPCPGGASGTQTCKSDGSGYEPCVCPTGQEPKTEAASEPKIEAVQEPKTEIVSEPKIEAASEPKVEIVQEPKTEIASEPKAEAVSEQVGNDAGTKESVQEASKEQPAPEKAKVECTLQIPKVVKFKATPVGRRVRTLVEIFNVGNFDCPITKLQAIVQKPLKSNAFKTSLTSNSTFTIAPGKKYELYISFEPLAFDSSYEGKFFLSTSDAKNPLFEIKLEAPKPPTDRCLLISHRELKFEDVKVGCSAKKRKILLLPTNNANCPRSVVLKSLKILSNPNNEFAINNLPSSFPVTVNVSKHQSIEISYKPTKSTNSESVLLIETNLPGQEQLEIHLHGKGISTDKQKDAFNQWNKPTNDVLFVVTKEAGNNLGKFTLSFVNKANKAKSDYHLGVIPADQLTGASLGCLHGTPKYATSASSSSVLSSNFRPGGSTNSKALASIYYALSIQNLINPKCNKGFIRDNASLSIIIISERKDQYFIERTFVIDYLKNFKHNGLVKLHVVGGPPPSGCKGFSPFWGGAYSDPTLWGISKQFNGIQLSLCKTPFTQTFEKLADASFVYQDQFTLSRYADSKTLQVNVNGQAVKEDASNGWQYISTSNSIKFFGTALPASSAKIEAQYQAVCSP